MTTSDGFRTQHDGGAADRRQFPVSSERLEARVHALSKIGALPSGGVYRGLYDEAWAEAQDLVESWMRADGLVTSRDGVGNVFGTSAAASGAGAVLTGSHIDTVRAGGNYDGALGVIASIEAVAVLRREYGVPAVSLQAVSICEEEGSRFDNHFWGARAICGLIPSGEAGQARDQDGVSLEDAMVRRGLDPRASVDCTRDDVRAFLELHIEQGSTLTRNGLHIGIVETITGQRHLRVSVEGRQGHPGTSPMNDRADPVVASAQMIVELTGAVEEAGHPAVATVGSFTAHPGSANVIAGRVDFTVDLRHPETTVLEALLARVEKIAQAVASRFAVEADVCVVARVAPVGMDEQMRSLIGAAADRAGCRSTTLTSGAGHDSQIFAQITPTGMIFLPSQGGLSHTPDEFTPLPDIVRGVQVLARSLHSLAYQ